MRFNELVQMSADELEKKEKEIKLELIKLNSQVATGTNPKNPGQIRNLKKSLARIKTIKRQNE